jgi:N-acetylglucosaminyldiphosphoundecaprenol N-acetyl-beta-D-mannosaminyltransferase
MLTEPSCTTESCAPAILEHARANILGVGIGAISLDVALSAIQEWIGRGEQHYVCVATVHSVMEAQRDSGLRAILNASGLTTPDGMPLVWLSRLLGFRSVSRVYGPDLMLAMCQRSVARGYRHYLYGGGPGVAERLAERLVQRFPGLHVVGTCSPPFRSLTPSEDEEAVGRINAARPDIVWVGLGAPKQERWLASHVGRVKASVLIGVGAAFDFHSGRKRQAPRWMQRSGLEWLFRLCQEPGRLWYRYLVYSPAFVVLASAQLLGIARYRLDTRQVAAAGEPNEER